MLREVWADEEDGKLRQFGHFYKRAAFSKVLGSGRVALPTRPGGFIRSGLNYADMNITMMLVGVPEEIRSQICILLYLADVALNPEKFNNFFLRRKI